VKRPGRRVRAAAVVPIGHGGVVIAALNVASRTRAEFPRQGAALTEALAAQVGGAIERLREEAALREELARLREREASGRRSGSDGGAE
jgi:GAF domain-containing protein